MFNPRVLFALTLCSVGGFLAVFSFAENPQGAATNRRVNFSSASAAGSNETGLYRGMPVTYVVRNGKAIFQGDIILEKIEARPAVGGDSLGVAYSQYLWPKVGNQYEIPYVVTSGSGNLTNLNTALAQFNSTFSKIKFIARTTETDYVNFYFDPNNNSGQCEANLGRAGGEEHVGGAGGSFNPCTIGTVLHEMGHIVGLYHEQARPDRNTYLSVNYGNVIKGSIFNFNQVYDNAQQTTLFDYASVMNYSAFALSRNGGPVMESIPAGIPLSNPNGYSAADIDGIQRLYSQAPTAVTVTSNPSGLQVIVDGVTVTTPHIYSNWALNSTHTLGIPSGVQSQSGFIGGGTEPTTFYYTYGRWNDSTAASHGITVLPGNGGPTTPATSPAVTTYTANFIQLVPYTSSVYPVGAGTVDPSPAPQSYPGSGLLFHTARQQVTLTATPNSGQNFYAFVNGPYYLPGGIGANPKTFYVPDNGLTIDTTVLFSPNPVYTVNVAPNPFSSNLYIYADGGFAYAPRNFSVFYDSTWTPGSMHTLSVDNPQYPYSFGSRYAFANWSDGATTATRTVTIPSTSTAYTANLTPQFFVTDNVYESCAGSIDVSPNSPTFDGFYPSGTVVTFSETHNAGWLFTGWQYDLSGTLTPKLLTVTDEVLVTADYNAVATPLTLTSLSPTSVVSGSLGFTLTLNGTGFTPGSGVSVKGAFPPVTFINSTQLSVPVTASQIATPEAFQVWVDNRPSGATCGAFVALPFTVNSPTPTPPATPTPTPSPTPAAVGVSGTVTYCSSPALDAVPNVTMTRTGTSGGVTTTNGSGNYAFAGLASGGSYTVTPSKPALAPGVDGIDGGDVVAVIRHVLEIPPGLPAGCQLDAADADTQAVGVDGSDIVAILRFYLGFPNSPTSRAGQYRFTPANRSYSSVVSNQTGQDYNALIYGDVVSSFVYRPEGGPSQDAADEGEVASTVAVALRDVAVDPSGSTLIAALTATAIPAKNNLVGFQGNIIFDERVVTFDENRPVQAAGLTAGGNWNVVGHILPGPGPLRTLRLLGYSSDFTPLSGKGTLFELRMTRVSKTAESTHLIWATPPHDFLFIDADSKMQPPGSAAPGSLTPRSSRQ